MLNRYRYLTLAGLLVGGLWLPAQAADQNVAVPAPAGQSAPMADRVEARIGKLHDRLRVTPDQEPSFAAVANIMRDQRKEHDERIKENRQAQPDLTAVDDLNRYAQTAQAHADGIKQLAQAFESFYGTLSADQKKIADETFREYKHDMTTPPRPRHSSPKRAVESSQ